MTESPAIPAPELSFRSVLIKHIAQYVTNADQCGDDYDDIVHALWVLLSPVDREALDQLVRYGPVWDGDVVSKSHRDFLLELKLAVRVCCKGESGHTAATYRGHDVWRGGR